jgi:hypothetical protein
MLVNITANILENSPLAPNHPSPDWPIFLKVSDDEGQTKLECTGKLKAGELQSVILGIGASASDAEAIPQFLKKLMARKIAEIKSLDIPETGIQMLRDLIRVDDFTSAHRGSELR